MIIPAEKYSSLSRSIDEKVVQPADNEQPPPYVEGSRAGSSSDPHVPHRTNSVFQSTVQQHANGISLYSTHNAISGSWVINPELPSHLTTTSPLSRKHKRYLKRDVTPNASFKTRHGAISLNLATAGNDDKITKTYVQVGTRHGKVNLNLFALQPRKHITLEVCTRHAPITLFVPPNFHGVLQLRSRKGSFKFLPAFAQQARVVNADDDGALVLFGQGDIPVSTDPSLNDALDFCLITTRHGKITIGISGIDTLDTGNAETNLFKKLGNMFLN
jgi:hypothetical protein